MVRKEDKNGRVGMELSLEYGRLHVRVDGTWYAVEDAFLYPYDTCVVVNLRRVNKKRLIVSVAACPWPEGTRLRWSDNGAIWHTMGRIKGGVVVPPVPELA